MANCLSQTGPHTIDELAPELYKGLPAPLMRFARYQILAGLLKLQQEGRAEKTALGNGETWRLSAGRGL